MAQANDSPPQTQSIHRLEPREAPGVSACMIVRDEEGWLERCLASLRGWVDEICVLDTGSSDRSVQIARAHGARVHHFVWQDDFSAARNASLEMATQPWILVVDADEELTPESGAALRRAIAASDRQVWLVYQDNLVGQNQVRPLAVPRLFRNRPEIRFRRRVHESVMESLIALGEGDLMYSGVHLLHHGYLPSALEKRDKGSRNLDLLRRCHREDPNDLFVLYKLGTSLREPEQRRERIDLLERALEQARLLDDGQRRTYPFLPLVYDGLAQDLCRAGRLQRAIEVVEEGLYYFPATTDLRFRRGDLARRAGARLEARKWLGSCVGAERSSPIFAGNPATAGVMPLLGLIRPAVEAGKLAEAKLLVAHALSIDPFDLSARRLDIEVKLANDDTAVAGIADLKQFIADHPFAPEVLVLSGQFAWSEGDAATATALWRQAAGSDSDAGLEARCLLALASLKQRDLAGALEFLPELTPREVTSAACQLLLSVIADEPVTLDPAFSASGVTEQLAALLRELLADPENEYARAFADNAVRYTRVLPGIETLLVEE